VFEQYQPVAVMAFSPRQSGVAREQHEAAGTHCGNNVEGSLNLDRGDGFAAALQNSVVFFIHHVRPMAIQGNVVLDEKQRATPINAYGASSAQSKISCAISRPPMGCKA